MTAFGRPKHSLITLQLALENKFNIVLALGVLVSRVQDYTDYIQVFIEKIIRYSGS